MNIHLNVFKANGSKAIRESGWINHGHCVEDVQKAKHGAEAAICAGKDAAWTQDTRDLRQQLALQRRRWNMMKLSLLQSQVGTPGQSCGY